VVKPWLRGEADGVGGEGVLAVQDGEGFVVDLAVDPQDFRV
jgi:hypothetical protein